MQIQVKITCDDTEVSALADALKLLGNVQVKQVEQTSTVDVNDVSGGSEEPVSERDTLLDEAERLGLSFRSDIGTTTLRNRVKKAMEDLLLVEEEEEEEEDAPLDDDDDDKDDDNEEEEQEESKDDDDEEEDDPEEEDEPPKKVAKSNANPFMKAKVKTKKKSKASNKKSLFG